MRLIGGAGLPQGRNNLASLDQRAITDQKVAVGLVENPCCWRLRDEAARVPANRAIVELGAFKGRSTGWLVLGAQSGHGARVVSVDPWESADEPPASYARLAKSVPEYRHSQTRQAYEHHLDEAGIRPFVDVVQATAQEAAAGYDGPPVSLLWHDALHRRQDVRGDLRAWLPHLADDAVIILHDVGDPRMGVEAGARDALSRRKGWDWAGREVVLWEKQPHLRGFMVVRHG